MKTKILTTALTTSIMLASGVAVADTGSCGEGCAWSFDSSTGALTITGSGLTVMDDYASATNAAAGKGSQAPWISNMGNITSVNISGVSHVSANAFDGATNLQTATIPEGVTSIGARAFNESGVQTVSLPTTLTTMGNAVFQSAASLTSVDIPDSVTSFGQGMFNKASSLTDVKLPSGLTEIPVGTFQYNTSLTTVDIPSTVTAIGNAAFNGASSLANITIPDGVTSIGDGAFQNATSLTNVALPDGVTNLGAWAFWGASSLSEVNIPEGITSIERQAFGQTALTNVVIPAGVMSIGDGAFYNTTTLEGLTFATDENGNSSLISIGDSAFDHCAFSSIDVPDSVTSIGGWAFGHNENLVEVILPDGLTSLGYAFLSRSNNVASIILPESLFEEGAAGVEAGAFGYIKNITVYCPEGNQTCLNSFQVEMCPEGVPDDRDNGLGCMVRASDIANFMSNTYRQDANGNYIMNGIRYSSFADMAQNRNAHPMRRMYTVEEAERASRNTGNTIKLRYK